MMANPAAGEYPPLGSRALSPNLSSNGRTTVFDRPAVMAQIDEMMSSFRAAGHQTLLIRFGPPLRPRARSAAQFSSACLNNRGCARRAFGHAGRSSTCEAASSL